MVEIINHGRKIIEPVIIYVGTTFHYVMQIAQLDRFEGAVNVMVGVFVAIYTLTRIIDWTHDRYKAREENKNTSRAQTGRGDETRNRTGTG